jgi:hypothetical protein
MPQPLFRTALDVALEQAFFPTLRRGRFVDCQAGDGQSFSPTLYFELSRDWTGLNLEADPALFPALVRNRPRCTNLNLALAGGVPAGQPAPARTVTFAALAATNLLPPTDLFLMDTGGPASGPGAEGTRETGILAGVLAAPADAWPLVICIQAGHLAADWDPRLGEGYDFACALGAYRCFSRRMPSR